jgi:hypothetical protein
VIFLISLSYCEYVPLPVITNISLTYSLIMYHPELTAWCPMKFWVYVLTVEVGDLARIDLSQGKHHLGPLCSNIDFSSLPISLTRGKGGGSNSIQSPPPLEGTKLGTSIFQWESCGGFRQRGRFALFHTREEKVKVRLSPTKFK